jgi:hypothetical protein
MSDTKWSYLDAKRTKHGPFSKEDMLKLAGNGTINGETFVWHAGLQDWIKFGEAVEVKSASSENPTGNLLSQRLGGQGMPSSQNPKSKRGISGSVKFAALVVLVAGLIVLNKTFLILPGAGGVVDSDIPDRWFSEDNREGAIMQCTFSGRGKGSGGGPRYRVAATVSAGNARGRRLPLDRSGNSRVTIRDSAGKAVFDQFVSNAKLCPS